jgi:uncharacterized membrane protein
MDIDPIDDPMNYKWEIFYINKNDIRTLVPKRTRALGWTFNFAKPISFVVMGLLLLIVLAAIISAIFVK